MRGILAVGMAALLLTSCQPSIHPNQISDFDGKTYDSLLLAHGALVALREQVRTQNRAFIPAFDKTVKAYNSAYEAYAVYRVTPQVGTVAASILVQSLASSISALEQDITGTLPAEPAKVSQIRVRHMVRRSRFAASRPRYEMSLIDILTALQTGAEIARIVPIASPYATLALLVINATQSAVQNAKSNSGRPIDLALIVPIAAI